MNAATRISAVVLITLFAACDTFRSTSSILNVSKSSFHISASFSNVSNEDFVQAPETFVQFSESDRNAMVPSLSHIKVRSADGTNEYELTADQIGRLEADNHGIVSLLLFDSGLAVAPQDVANKMSRARNLPQLLEIVRQNKSACFEHTAKLFQNQERHD